VRELKETATAFPLARTLEVKTGAEKAFFDVRKQLRHLQPKLGRDSRRSQERQEGPLVLGAAGTVKSGGKEGRFVAVGSSNFLGNNILKFNGNRDLFLNMMNWLSSDEDLISIRPKDPEDRRLTLTSRQMSTIFSSSVIGLPLIVIAPA
jgi:ABC-type uncharacterized transport system involved in gliding motility auxiliary subunit